LYCLVYLPVGDTPLNNEERLFNMTFQNIHIANIISIKFIITIL
jgi:hypothetical protein